MQEYHGATDPLKGRLEVEVVQSLAALQHIVDNLDSYTRLNVHSADPVGSVAADGEVAPEATSTAEVPPADAASDADESTKSTTDSTDEPTGGQEQS